MQFHVRVEHEPDLRWLDIRPGDCKVEISATCRQCQTATITHLSEIDLMDLYAHYGPRWGLGMLHSTGWETESGICPECYRLIRTVARSVN